MTSSKLSLLTRTAPMLSLVLMVGGILFAGPLATIQQTAATTTLTAEEQDIQDTQDFAAENITEEDRDVNGIEFTPRWGAISTLEPNEPSVLFADCFEDEFAVSTQFAFQSSDILAFQSFPWASPDDDLMTWIALVENTDSSNDRAAAIGVICAGENDGDDDDYDIDYSTKTTINNIVKNFIRVENNQIVNLNNIINIRQQIVQNAIQVLTITGNNNTVNQVINQAATQIANVNATSPTEIQEIIDQSAQQQGVISETGNETSLSQAIEQEAAQEANVTEVEDGATDIDQAIEQEAAQEANVTDEDGVDTSIEQLIQERAQQQAQVDEQQQQQQLQQPAEGDAIVIDQAIGQNTSQQAQVDVEGIPGNSTGDFGQVLGNSTGN
jgi:hypothetical protein